MSKQQLTIATRKSPLALWQARHIAQQICSQHPNLKIQLVELLTQGDKDKTTPLLQLGGKTLFVKELQRALLEGKADIAVHCIKDLSVHPCPELTLAAVCRRADPRDVLVSRQQTPLMRLAAGAVVGTSSPRRQCLIQHLRPDIIVKPLRGNVGTRLQKVDRGEYDAIVLAHAGLTRLDMGHKITEHLDPQQFVPAIGQGALGIECRTQDTATKALIAHLNHEDTAICVSAERAVNQVLGGDCYTPVGAYATLSNHQLQIRAMVGSLDGAIILNSEMAGPPQTAQILGNRAAEALLQQGAQTLLKS